MIQALAAGVAAMAFGLLFNIRGKNIVFAGLNGALGYGVYLLLGGFQNYVSIFFASCAISLYAEIFARLRKAPASTFLIAAMIPLVPGGGIFQTFLYLLGGDAAEAVSKGLETLLEAGAICVGIVVVSSLVRLLSPLWAERK